MMPKKQKSKLHTKKIEAAYEAALQDTTYETIAAYYQALADEGFAYGAMAKGVVLDNSFVGVVANNYAENKLERDFGSEYDTRRLEIQRELMQADHQARLNAGWADINGEQIADYHIVVFNDLYPSVPNAHEAWTAYHIIQALGDSEFWLTSSTAGQSLLFFQMIGMQLGSATAPAYANAFEWVQDMRSFYVLDKREWSWTKGDGVRDASLAEYFGSQVLDFSNQHIKPLTQKANDFDARLWTQSAETLFQDAILARNGFDQATLDGLFSTTGGRLQIDTARAAEIASAGNDWLGAIKLGLKASIFGALNATTWSAMTEGSASTDSLYAAIDGMNVSKITFQKDASTLTAGHANELLLGDSTAGDFYAGDLGAFIFASGGADALYGGAGKDILVGGTGADLLKSAGDSDILDGGAGNDVYDISQSAQDLLGPLEGDWIYEEILARQPEINFRVGSGHDVIIENLFYDGYEPDWWAVDEENGTAVGLAIGLEAVEFKGINSTDVTLHWDRHQSERRYDEFIQQLFDRVLRHGDFRIECQRYTFFLPGRPQN